MEAVIIDNCVVSRFMTDGLSIKPIKLAVKNPNFNLLSLDKITYGNRLKDNRVLQQLADGLVNFDDLRTIDPSTIDVTDCLSYLNNDDVTD